MSVGRALVQCSVLSVQDSCVFYPRCGGCFSRIDVDQQDASRCRCSRCGYSCLREQVEYRYRLSLRVARDRCIFGVTVFGTCLEPFFGIPASGLQRLVENLDGPVGASTKATLLVKAVKDCFIGRHFIFGVKVTGTESGLCFGGPVANTSSTKETVQFIASQMILPKAAGLGGCTVVSYYRILLQKASECGLVSTILRNTSRPQETTPLLFPHQSPSSSFNNVTFSLSGLLSQSLRRSQDQDCTLTPTPPWQQSLGLVTSSAEQEEGCSTQDKTSCHVQRGCLENHRATEPRTLSPPLSLGHSSYSSPPFAKYPYTSVVTAVENTLSLNTWFSPSQPDHKRDLTLRYKAKGVSTRRLTKTFLSSSLDWEDLPFSESLTEFLVEENKDFDIVSETKPHLNIQNQKEQKETVRNNLDNRSQDKNMPIESTSANQSNTQITEYHSWMLLDITNKPLPNIGSDKQDLSDQVCKNPVVFLNKSQARGINQCSQEDEETSSLSFENKEEGQLEGRTFDCSADLFSSSLMTDMNTNMLNTHAETIRITSEACTMLFSPDKEHLRNEKANVPHSTPGKQKQKCNKCINRDSLISVGAQDLDFIPPAQSTPIVKVAVVSGSPASSYSSTSGEYNTQPDFQDLCSFYSNLPDLDSKKAPNIISPLCKLNTVNANRPSRCGRESTKENLVWSRTSSRQNHRFTPKKKLWASNKHNDHLLVQQNLRAQRAALSLGPTLRINHKYDSSVCDVTVCEYEDKEVIVPPTPAAKTQLNVRLRRCQADKSGGLVSTSEAQQGDGINCKRTRLDQTFTSSQRGLAQTGNFASEIVDEGCLDGSNGYLLDDENQAYDWSRDLFSNSVSEVPLEMHFTN